MACETYTTYVNGCLNGLFDVPFVAFEAPRLIEGATTLGLKPISALVQTQFRHGGRKRGDFDGSGRSL